MKNASRGAHYCFDGGDPFKHRQHLDMAGDSSIGVSYTVKVRFRFDVAFVGEKQKHIMDVY